MEPTNIETPLTNVKQPDSPKQTITKTPPPHVKNPKRVAQGKKIALISKAAKQKKKEQRLASEVKEKNNTSLITTTGTILGTCCTLLLTYIAYSQWSKEETEDKNPPKIKKTPVVYNDLSKYDL